MSNSPQLGDIILTRSNSFISRAIRRFEREGAEPALVSHAGIFVAPDLVIEAIAGKGVITSRFPEDFNKCEYVVSSPKNVTIAECEVLKHVALSYSARRYGWFKILAQLLDYLLGVRFFTVWVFKADRYPYCSFVVAQAYKEIGKDFDVPVTSTTPDDILDFIIRSKKYAFVAATPELLADLEHHVTGV